MHDLFLEVAKNKVFISEKIYATHIALLLLLEELAFFIVAFKTHSVHLLCVK